MHMFVVESLHMLIYSVFGSAYVELILYGINFVRINFEVKWFIFGSSSRSDSYLVVPLKVILIESKKFSLLPELILEIRIDFSFGKPNIIKNSYNQFWHPKINSNFTHRGSKHTL